MRERLGLERLFRPQPTQLLPTYRPLPIWRLHGLSGRIALALERAEGGRNGCNQDKGRQSMHVAMQGRVDEACEDRTDLSSPTTGTDTWPKRTGPG